MNTQETYAPNFNTPGYKEEPADLEMEMSVLGHILLIPTAINDLNNWLPSEAFSMRSHQIIYRAAMAINDDEGGIVDMMSMVRWLTDHKLLEKVGGQTKIAQLVDTFLTIPEILINYATTLFEKYIARETIKLGNLIRDWGYESAQHIGTTIQNATAEINRLSDLLSSGKIRLSAEQVLVSKVKRTSLIVDTVEQYFAWSKLSAEYKKPVQELEKLRRCIDANEDLEVLSAPDFANLQLTESEWLIQGLLKLGTSALLVAESKTGKSLLHYDWAYSVATGESWGEFPITKAQKVLIIQTDEPRRDCQDRIKQRGLDKLENVDIITKFKPQQLNRIRELVKEGGHKFVIIDSITSVNRHSGIDVNDAKFANLMYDLKELADEEGFTILLIHHTNKTANEGLSKVAGNYSIPASVSQIFMLEKCKSGTNDLTRILSLLGGRNDAARSWKIELNLEDGSFIWHGNCSRDGNSDTATEQDGEKKLQTKEAIVSFLRFNSPVAFEAIELANELHLNDATVRAAVNTLVKESVIARKPSTINPRAKSYYIPLSMEDTQLIIETHDQLDDQLDDQLAKPDTVKVTAVDHPTDHQVNAERTFSDFPESQKNTVDDQLMISKKIKPRKPDSVKVTSTDHPTDHQLIIENNDQLIDKEIVTPKHSFKIGDRCIEIGDNKYGEIIEITQRGSDEYALVNFGINKENIWTEYLKPAPKPKDIGKAVSPKHYSAIDRLGWLHRQGKISTLDYDEVCHSHPTQIYTYLHKIGFSYWSIQKGWQEY